MVLKELIFNREGVVVLKELIFNNFYFGGCVVLKELIYNIGRVWGS